MTDGQWRRNSLKYIHYLTYKKIIPPVIAVNIGYPEESSPGVPIDYGQARIKDFITDPDRFRNVLGKGILPLVESKYSVNPNRRFLIGISARRNFLYLYFD